jgi:hypothetical protein
VAAQDNLQPHQFRIPKNPDLIHRVIHEREWTAANSRGYFAPSEETLPEGQKAGTWFPSEKLYAASKPISGYAQTRGPHRVVTFDRHKSGWQLGQGYHENEVGTGAEITFVNPGHVPVTDIHHVTPPLNKKQLSAVEQDWRNRG